MAVSLSPLGGAGAQFFDNSGVPLSGGKIYTYAAGTTTPLTTYTTSAGNVARTNPIVLDAAGRVDTGGEIWLTQNVTYKFVLKDATDVLIATYDNLYGMSNVTLPVDAANVEYNPPFPGAVSTTGEDKFAQWVSVKDFGAVGDGVTDDTLAIQTAFLNGGNVYFPTGTYKVGTVVCQNVNDLNINAGNAVINGLFGNVFYFNNCNDFTWTGGVINSATGVNPATNTPGTPLALAIPWCQFNASRVIVQNMFGNNNPANPLPPIVFWNITRGTIVNNVLYGGGDNSIWVFGTSDIVCANNAVYANERGRAICFQQVSRGSITGNLVTQGKGDGLNVHGSDNIVIAANTVSNMAVDTAILTLAAGIGIEWDENATPAQVAAAAADLFLYNKVFSRNITVTGNTIANISGFSIRIGNNSGVSGASYGNQGIVTIVGNTFAKNNEGIANNCSQYVTIKGNNFRSIGTSFISVVLGADTGGYLASNLTIAGNKFDTCDTLGLGYSPIHFTGASSYNQSRNFVLNDNEFVNVAVGYFSNLQEYVNKKADRTRWIGTNYQTVLDNTYVMQGPAYDIASPAFFDVAALPRYKTKTFSIAADLTDAWTPVFTMPTLGSGTCVIMKFVIGLGDRMVQAGIFTAANSTPGQSNFSGFGSGYIQLNGNNIEVRGYTSSGALPYGGYFSAELTVLNNG